eukprot:SAG31_NODE_923_length_10969_cov_6.723091_4_plen_180_part_00
MCSLVFAPPHLGRRLSATQDLRAGASQQNLVNVALTKCLHHARARSTILAHNGGGVSRTRRSLRRHEEWLPSAICLLCLMTKIGSRAIGDGHISLPTHQVQILWTIAIRRTVVRLNKEGFHFSNLCQVHAHTKQNDNKKKGGGEEYTHRPSLLLQRENFAVVSSVQELSLPHSEGYRQD